jgi:dTDP-4-dehydrorhamnose reductase
MGELNLLVLGDGLLGSEIVKQSSCDYQSRKKTELDISNPLTWKFDKYDIIINCIANTDTYSNDRQRHWDVNYKFVNELIDYCNTHNKKIVHISTDYLYTGSVDNATELDIPVHCNNWYGYTKLLSDGLVQLKSNNYLICRCMHKPNPFPYNKAWINQIGNFDYVNVISNLILSLIKKNACGVYNVGTDTKTMLDLAKQTNSKVEAALCPELVPKNITMSMNKLNSKLNIPFFSVAIPVYEYKGRGSALLLDNFRKLEKQTFQNFEVVVSDHSISNEIENLCIDWSNRLNIIYVKNNVGRGFISPNMNSAMKNSNGKYIKMLFQDDFLFDSDSLKNTYDFILSKGDVKWLATKFYHSTNGIDMIRPMIPRWNDNIWTGNNTIGCPSVICVKNENLIFFDETLNWMMDVEYYKRVYDQFGEPEILDKFTVVNKTYLDENFRPVGNISLSSTMSDSIKNEEIERVKNKYARS